MLLTINSCFQGRGTASINRLLEVRKSNYDLRGVNALLSLPRVDSTKTGLNYFS